MAVTAFISPFPSPWYVGSSMPKFRVKLADAVGRRPFDISGAVITGKLGTQVLGGTFAVEYARGGVFTYAPVVGDAPVGLVGRQNLQFVATNGASVWKADLIPIDVKASL